MVIEIDKIEIESIIAETMKRTQAEENEKRKNDKDLTYLKVANGVWEGKIKPTKTA